MYQSIFTLNINEITWEYWKILNENFNFEVCVTRNELTAFRMHFTIEHPKNNAYCVVWHPGLIFNDYRCITDCYIKLHN